jgi:P22_AR N-terminal domain
MSDMGDMITRQLFETLKYHLGEWDLDLFLVRTPDVKDPKDCWFSVRPICEQMGIDISGQRERLQADHRFTGYLKGLPVKTSAGYRTSLCMRIEKIGLWFTLISPLKINPKFRGKLEALQADIERKATEAVLGDASLYLLPKQGNQETLIEVVRGEMNFHCPSCSAALCIVIDETGYHVMVGEETI